MNAIDADGKGVVMAKNPRARIMVQVEAEILDLAQAYLVNRRRDVVTIETALKRGDFETIRRIGHNMQGSGCTFGFEPVTVIGAELQRAVKAENRAEVARLQGRLADYVSRVEVTAAAREAPQAGGGQVPAVAPDHRACDQEHGDDAPRILVVDDQKMNRALISHYLEKEGYTVTQAASGDEALAALEHCPPPAVILLDVVMCGMSGFEVCRRIKSSPATLPIPVVLVTSFERREDCILGMAAGADGFLSKPVDRQALLARVSSLVRLNRAFREARRHELPAAP